MKLNRCYFQAASAGAANFVYSEALAGFQSPVTAGATNGQSFYYIAEVLTAGVPTQWELGVGTWTTDTLTRSALESSNSGLAVDFSAPPKVRMGVPLAADWPVVRSLTAGSGVTIDSTDPENPAISASGGGGGVTTDSITTGASPVAANPNTNITYITMGDTAGDEIIELGLPDDPQDKLGHIKRFVMLFHGSSDTLVLDLTNVVASGGQPETGNFFGQVQLLKALDYVDLQLVWASDLDTPQFAWQFYQSVEGAFSYKFSSRFMATTSEFGENVRLQGGNATGSGEQGGGGILEGGTGLDGDGGDAQINGGTGINGIGGRVQIQPGSGTTDGGDVVIELPAAGSGRQGLFFVNNLPTSDPGESGALYNDGGTIKISP